MANKKEESDDEDEKKELQLETKEWIEIKIKLKELGLDEYCNVLKENGLTSLEDAKDCTEQELIKYE